MLRKLTGRWEVANINVSLSHLPSFFLETVNTIPCQMIAKAKESLMQ